MVISTKGLCKDIFGMFWEVTIGLLDTPVHKLSFALDDGISQENKIPKALCAHRGHTPRG